MEKFKLEENQILKLLKNYVNKDVITKIKFLNLIVDLPLSLKEAVMEYFKDDKLMEEILK